MSGFLVAAFLLTALVYASAGFGGGSTYTALLVISGADYRVLPAISLLCNVIVVSGGVWRFSQTGDLSVRRLMPFLAASVPAAWIGGRIAVGETLFIGLLGGALLVAGLHLAFQKSVPDGAAGPAPRGGRGLAVPLFAGGAIGLLSGVVGIGGGIFLAPALYFLRWGTPRQIAAAASLFILLNSLAGLAGHVTRLGDLALLPLAAPYWPLPLAVLLGGQAGSWLAGYRLDPGLIRRVTAVLILYAALRLLWRWFALV